MGKTAERKIIGSPIDRGEQNIGHAYLFIIMIAQLLIRYCHDSATDTAWDWGIKLVVSALYDNV